MKKDLNPTEKYYYTDSMDLGWDSEATEKFVTNVGLITSNGSHGQNIMACEWTHHISYSPGLIAVCIRLHKATAENIKETKEFGVNICSTDQSTMSSISGNYSGKEYNKVEALKELGFKFYKAKKINTLMVEGAAANIECKLIKLIDIGDHPLFVGEVVDVSVNPKEPLAYYKGKYWKTSEKIAKPPQEILDKIERLLEKHKK